MYKVKDETPKEKYKFPEKIQETNDELRLV